MEKSHEHCSNALIWISGYPSHYMRRLHTELSALQPGFIKFVYISKNNDERKLRSYEEGTLPDGRLVIEAWNEISEVFKLMKQNDCQRVIVSGTYPRILLGLILWSQLRGLKVYYQSDSNVYDYKRKGFLVKIIKRLLLGAMFKKIYGFLYIGEANKKYYQAILGNQYSSKPMFFFPYAHHPLKFESNAVGHVVDISRIRFLYVGRMIPQKAVENLINAFKQLRLDDRTRAELILVGDGPERTRLESLVRDFGMLDRVKFLGAVSSEEICRVYAEADVFVLPSAFEPWGMVVNEALSSGRPVIAAGWVGATQDLIINNRTGIRLLDNSVDSLKGALEFFINSPQLIVPMGISGQKLVRTRGFHSQTCIDFISYLKNDVGR